MLLFKYKGIQVWLCANMQIRPGFAPVSTHMQRKEKKGSERRVRYVHGILREKFEKSLSLRKHWPFHTDRGEFER